jgi:hypothetical protein
MGCLVKPGSSLNKPFILRQQVPDNIRRTKYSDESSEESDYEAAELPWEKIDRQQVDDYLEGNRHLDLAAEPSPQDENLRSMTLEHELKWEGYNLAISREPQPYPTKAQRDQFTKPHDVSLNKDHPIPVGGVVDVVQGTVRVASKDDENQIIGSRCAGPCVIAIVYNPATGRASVGHIDAITHSKEAIDMLQKKASPDGEDQELHVHLCTGADEMTIQSEDENPLLVGNPVVIASQMNRTLEKLLFGFSGPNFSLKSLTVIPYGSLAIDARTGQTYTKLDKKYFIPDERTQQQWDHLFYSRTRERDRRKMDSGMGSSAAASVSPLDYTDPSKWVDLSAFTK